MNSQLMTIRAKKFGVRLAGYRQRKNITTETLSKWTDIPQEKIEEVESGEASFSLPQVELIAIKLGLLTDTLINGKLDFEQNLQSETESLKQYQSLRDRMISLILRKTRTEQSKSLAEISSKCGLSETELDQYESGEQSLPLPILECLCEEYQLPLSSLYTKTQTDQPHEIEPAPVMTDTEKDDEMAAFVQNPANLAYLQLAKKLSELDSAKLRAIAEGLLEITY